MQPQLAREAPLGSRTLQKSEARGDGAAGLERLSRVERWAHLPNGSAAPGITGLATAGPPAGARAIAWKTGCRRYSWTRRPSADRTAWPITSPLPVRRVS